MASGAHVTLRGRFSPGEKVKLVKVDGPHVRRSEGGDVVEEKTVERNDDGIAEVRFSKGVEEGASYLIVGLDAGVPREVRAKGKTGDDPGPLFQPPIQPNVLRNAAGMPVNEKPTKESAPRHPLGPTPGLHQVPKGTVLRSDTPWGEAHPLDPSEPAPYGRQEDVPKGVVQMSDTPTGRPTPIEVGPQRQEDVPKSTLQRSATPTGEAKPIPKGDAVEAQQERESSEAKEKRGDTGQAAAHPISHAKPVTGASKEDSEKRHEKAREDVEEARGVRIDDPHAPKVSGHDAQGQPLSEESARAANVEAADKPAESKPHTKSSSSRSRSRSQSTKAKEK